MTFKIIVTDPASKKSISWESDNKERLIDQARAEVKAGATVEVKNALGRIVWSG